MNKKLRIRDRELDADLTMWKLLPVFFLIILFIVAATMGTGAPSGDLPPAIG